MEKSIQDQMSEKYSETIDKLCEYHFGKKGEKKKKLFKEILDWYVRVLYLDFENPLETFTDNQIKGMLASVGTCLWSLDRGR